MTRILQLSFFSDAHPSTNICNHPDLCISPTIHHTLSQPNSHSTPTTPIPSPINTPDQSTPTPYFNSYCTSQNPHPLTHYHLYLPKPLPPCSPSPVPPKTPTPSLTITCTSQNPHPLTHHYLYLPKPLLPLLHHHLLPVVLIYLLMRVMMIMEYLLNGHLETNGKF